MVGGGRDECRPCLLGRVSIGGQGWDPDVLHSAEIKLLFDETGDFDRVGEPIVWGLHEFLFETGGDLNRFHHGARCARAYVCILLDALEHMFTSCSMHSSIC